MKAFLSFLLTVVVVGWTTASAQDTTHIGVQEALTEVKGSVDGMNETLLEMKSTLDALKKIKLSGYIQTQYQTADTAGMASFDKTPSQIANFSGGSLPLGVQNRFQVRRGRLKATYDNDLTQYVLQIDVTQNGVGIKDAYAMIKEPWLKAASLTAGVFDRPFGFEISYSSGSRETPERSRLFQTLFPGERELGFKVEVAPETGPLSSFNLKAGLFNGVLSNANENDRWKDFIGRAGFTLPFDEENLSIDGGVSVYSGKVSSNSRFLYAVDIDAPTKRYRVDSTASNAWGSIGRTYYGADIQVYYDLPVLGGASLRGEYITGQQPGAALSNSFYNPGSTVTPLYIRNFDGWYITYVQNIGLSNQFVLKYDVFDPNTDVEGSDLGNPAATGQTAFTIGDVKYRTLGIGWIYHWDSNVKFTAYYDIPMNEKVNQSATGTLASFKDDIKDNVFTFRIQYKF